MDVEELSMVGPVVDLASVDSIHRKRIVAFVNHFIVHTSKFLNHLSSTVENKLLDINVRLQKLESAIILLECKLSSIPKLDVAIPVEKVSPLVEVPIVEEESKPEVQTSVVDKGKDEKTPETTDAHVEENDKTAIDESLMKYIKMLQFGVPMPAVKLKMQQEGFSPEQQNYVLSL